MELLKALYSIHSKSGKEETIRNFVKRCCENLGAKTAIDKAGNLYATKGESETYPCVVSHLDQVQDSHAADFRAILIGDVIFGFSESEREQQGLGADDKNGIWICLRCLQRFSAIKVAFFVGEEVGCVGSSDADMEFFENCRFVLQCDRKGSSDLISSVSYTELCSEQFLNDIGMEKFGYKKTSGLLTDVYTLKTEKLAVSCCNISCGYYNAHTSGEVTVVSELKNCFAFVCHIIENCVDVYPHEYVAPVYKYSGRQYVSGQYNRNCDYDSWYDDYYYGRGFGSSYGSQETRSSLDTIKEEEEYLKEDIQNEIWELLHCEPEMKFKDYWKNGGSYYGLKKKDVRALFNETVKDFKECFK